MVKTAERMRKFIFPLWMSAFLSSSWLNAQSVTEYEYWIDHHTAEAGRGGVESGLVDFNVDVSSLSDGIHTFSLRIRDDEDRWSIPYTRLFYKVSKPQEQEVVAYEYYIDDETDKRTSVVTDGGLVDFNTDVSSLSSGLHKLSLRTQDSGGRWSTPHIQYFYYVAPPRQTSLARVEYYWDDNCASRQTVNLDNSGVFSEDLDVSGFSDGLHKLFVRVQDTDSVWSTPYCRLFYKEGEARIIGYEYWFNKGYEERKFEPIEPVTVYDMKNVHVDVTPVWNLSGEDFEETPENTFHIRFKNSKGQWSELISHVFTKGQLQMDIADYEILKAFYLATGGDEWKHPWDISSSEIHAEQWDGVNFKGGKVYDIYLPENNLTGKLPQEIFSLSELESLNLSGNKLHGRIDSLFAGMDAGEVSGVLSSVNLSGNALSGEIVSFASAVPALRSLDLSGNRLTGAEGTLPEELEDVDLSNQFVAYVDELTGIPSLVRNAPVHVLWLGETMDVPLSSLQMYGFGEKDSDDADAPDLLITDREGKATLHLKYDTDALAYRCSLDKEWRLGRGDTLVAVQQEGVAAGYSMNVLFDYAMGDANIDHIVDVLDVQHSLNYALADGEGGVLPFNFSAADTYTDAQITVQDIVRTVELVLGTKLAETGLVKSLHGCSVADDADARLFIQDGRLVLETQIPVAAMDVAIDNVSEGEMRSLMNSNKFACVCCQSGHSLRMLVYSPSGNTFAVGRTELAGLYSKDARVATAVLSDADAHYVSVSIGDIADGLDVAKTDNGWDVCLADGHLVVDVPHGNVNLSIELLDMQGRVLAVKECGELMTGRHCIDIPLSGKGVYMVRVGNGYQYRILKFRK